MWRVDQARSDGELALPRHRKPVAVRRPVLSGGFPIGCGHREHGAHAADGGGHFTTSEGTSRSRSVFHDLAGDITTGVGVPNRAGAREAPKPVRSSPITFRAPRKSLFLNLYLFERRF